MIESLLTNPRLTDNQIYVVRPRSLGPYLLHGPYGELRTPARWAIFTDGLRPNNQFRTSINSLGKSKDGSWRIRTDDVSGQVVVTRYRDRQECQLTQDTRANPGYRDEVDLWLIAVADTPGLISQPGVIAVAQQPTLADMRALYFSWEEQVQERAIAERLGGWGDCALVMCSVYFKNQTTGQVIQYEIQTGDNRPFYPEGLWFANLVGGEFLGVVDNSATLYGTPYLSVGRPRRAVNFNILPRVRALLASAPNSNVARDPRQWRVLMATWGTFTNGAARIVTTWSNPQLSYEA